MKLLVRLHKDLTEGQKAVGIPDDWPAEVSEVDDSTPDPLDGRLVMTTAEFEAYKASKFALYNAWLEVDQIPLAKQAKFDAIDARTVELINQGFAYGPKRFSLSAQAQTTYTGLYAIRDEPILTFPVTINTLDDSGYQQLADGAAIRVFYLTAVGTYRAHLDSGTALKDQVRAAATLAAVEAIQDIR